MLELRREDFEALKDRKPTVVSSELRAGVSVGWSPWWKSNIKILLEQHKIYLYRRQRGVM
jgi:hypothetical protein